MLGYDPDELNGMNFSHLFLNENEQHRFFERLGSSEDINNFETQFATKERQRLYVNLSWRLVPGNLVSCSVIDINTRRLAEQAAEDNLAQYQQVTDSSPTGIIIRNNRILYANPAFQEFTGYLPGELGGREIAGLVHPEEKGMFPVFSDAERPNKPLPDVAAFRFVTKTGGTKLAAIFFTRIIQRGGCLPYLSTSWTAPSGRG